MTNRSIWPSCLECAVRRSSIFSDLTSEEVEQLECLKDASFYKKGQTIFQEGNHPKGIFCLSAGKVKIFKLGSNFKEQIVRLAREGDVLGYRSLISGDKYLASAATIEDSTICFIPREHLFKVLEDNMILSTNLMKLLSTDLASAETRMVEMMQKPVRERMAEGIIMLKEIYGLEEDGKTLDVIMTREDIANFIGTTTETAIRILSDLNAENIIALEKKKIIIKNFAKLLQESHIND
jgi:CRP/FNR family transcriptional regulator, polysaccharide utilization system transcription regulator